MTDKLDNTNVKDQVIAKYGRDAGEKIYQVLKELDANVVERFEQVFKEQVGKDAKEDELPLPFQAVLAYYFHTSDGTSLTGQWVSFADLPDGRMYNSAFQGYSGDEMVKVFGLDMDAFKSACEKSGGVATPSGDAGYIFYALPCLPMLVNYWCGDEDFPSSCKILFDSSASHYLPTDVCAILGSMLTRKVIKSAS